MVKPIDSLVSFQTDQLVVVKLWEIYVLYHPSNLYRFLTELSADQGPLLDKAGAGRIIFRFDRNIWEKQVKTVLYEHRIPVVISSGKSSISEKVTGRHPVIR